ncbi:MAG: hypothetical protein KY455_00190 [Euryarchaeota archaeon]|nr:hypothetical protein [Euryarchaeota archaeon]
MRRSAPPRLRHVRHTTAKSDGTGTGGTSGRPVVDEQDHVPCPHCGATGGYLLELDGAAYRVLEDDHDTELLAEGDLEGVHTITCLNCKRPVDAHAVLEAILSLVPQATPQPRVIRNKHPHRSGKAGQRTTTDGRTLPTCPECGATHDFFIDLGGAAYRVLEDDDDTDLLADAQDLLCSRCNAIFDLQ